MPPAAKASSARSRVEAMKLPPVTTLPPAPITTPFGLMTNTEPVALNRPSICDGLAPVTRFSVAPPPLLKKTELAAAIENAFQSMMARPPAWLIVSAFADPVIEPCPATNCPPFGSAPPATAGAAASTISNAAVAEKASAARGVARFSWITLPRKRPLSAMGR
ncbi:MAG: hypothetical protein WDN03_07955 [Rhizomicrobium sp.]